MGHMAYAGEADALRRAYEGGVGLHCGSSGARGALVPRPGSRPRGRRRGGRASTPPRCARAAHRGGGEGQARGKAG
eukprot:1805969-Prymnesium_polylepis.1